MLHQGARLIGIGKQHLHHLIHRHGIMIRVPAIKIRHHGDRCVAKLRLTREFRFGHICHANHATAPGAIKLTFGLGAELRAFHDKVGAAACDRQRQLARGCFQRVTQARADRMRDRDMRNTARAEEGFFARKTTVNELVHNDEMAGRQILPQGPHGGKGDDFRAANPLQRINIGAVIQCRWRDGMAAPMAGQEGTGHAIKPPGQDFIRRITPGRTHLYPPAILQPFHVIKPRTADQADHGLDAGFGLGHGGHSVQGLDGRAFSPDGAFMLTRARILRRARHGPAVCDLSGPGADRLREKRKPERLWPARDGTPAAGP